MVGSVRSDDIDALLEFEACAREDVALPADAHVVGEPVTVTRIRYSGSVRAGIMVACMRGGAEYELSLAEVVFPASSRGDAVAARYRAWLGLPPLLPALEGVRPHKVDDDDIAVGRPVELVVLACKSNALRCRLLGSSREITLRTAVREEIVGSIITVTPKKLWTHSRHPYLSGDVSALRIDAAVLGLAPLRLLPEDAASDARGHDPAEGGRRRYRLAPTSPKQDEASADLLFEAQDCIDARDYVAADSLLHEVLARDLRHQGAHAMLGERNLSTWPRLAVHHFELGVAVGTLVVGDDFDGELPWAFVENRPFLRCIDGLVRALWRCGRRDEAADASRRLLRLDPSDPFGAEARLATIESEKSGHVV